MCGEASGVFAEFTTRGRPLRCRSLSSGIAEEIVKEAMESNRRQLQAKRCVAGVFSRRGFARGLRGAINGELKIATIVDRMRAENGAENSAWWRTLVTSRDGLR